MLRTNKHHSYCICASLGGQQQATYGPENRRCSARIIWLTMVVVVSARMCDICIDHIESPVKGPEHTRPLVAKEFEQPYERTFDDSIINKKLSYTVRVRLVFAYRFYRRMTNTFVSSFVFVSLTPSYTTVFSRLHVCRSLPICFNALSQPHGNKPNRFNPSNNASNRWNVKPVQRHPRPRWTAQWSNNWSMLVFKQHV